MRKIGFYPIFAFLWINIAASSNTIVSGSVGEDVILPCIIKYEEEFLYNTLVIRWKTNDFFVHNFFKGRFQEKLQNRIFNGRTQLFSKEFPKGNFSLLLHNIRAYDAGVYECLVWIPEEMYTMKTELVVQDKSYGFTNESTVGKASVFVFTLCVLMGLIVFLRRRKRSRGRTGMPSGKCSMQPARAESAAKSGTIKQHRKHPKRRKRSH